MISHGVQQRAGYAFGEVTVEGTRCPTRCVLGTFMAGGGVRTTAWWWQLTVAQVEAAIRYEMCRRSRLKEHAWARELHTASLGRKSKA